MRWVLVAVVVSFLLAPAACEACCMARSPITKIAKAKPVRSAIAAPVKLIKKHCTKGICK